MSDNSRFVQKFRHRAGKLQLQARGGAEGREQDSLSDSPLSLRLVSSFCLNISYFPYILIVLVPLLMLLQVLLRSLGLTAPFSTKLRV